MMPLSEIFFLGIVLYLLYRFIFNFFVPIVRTTKHVREQFRNMQDPTNNTGGPFQQQSYSQPREEAKKKETKTPSNTMGEYIDFEEVK
jgi:hypothetical protein